MHIPCFHEMKKETKKPGDESVIRKRFLYSPKIYRIIQKYLKQCITEINFDNYWLEISSDVGSLLAQISWQVNEPLNLLEMGKN